MQDLQLIGVHEDGEHLLLGGADDARFRLPLDEALRAAIRRDRPHLGRQQIEEDGGLRPRDVQALIRAGASADEAASRAGWTVEKVHRYEGPILAEREHVAGLAQDARLRTRTGVSSGGSTPTLSARVTNRLKSRDVEATDTSWDSWRAVAGPWTVVLTFAAGGRQRQASWIFDLADRTVTAVDDEARWLSEEVQTAKGPIPAPKPHPSSGGDSTVYDVEAEGGLRPTAQDRHQDDPLDLMTAMRRRSTARGRRRPGGHAASPKAVDGVPATDEPAPDQSAPPADRVDGPAMVLAPVEADTSTDPWRGDADRRPGATTEPAASVPHAEPADDDLARADPALAGPARGDSPTRTSSEAGEESPEPAEESAQPGRSRARRPGREVNRKTGRPSVPAWDEIMFGSRPGADRSSS